MYLHTDDSGETTPPMYDGVARLQARALTAQGRLTDELARGDTVFLSNLLEFSDCQSHAAVRPQQILRSA